MRFRILARSTCPVLTVRKALRLVVVAALCSTAQPQTWAKPVTEDLDRPAVTVARPASAVLLALTSVGRDRLIGVGERGLIIISDDDGRNWRQVASPVSVSLTAVRFVDERSGWIVGHQGVVLHSNDGGLHWRVQLTGIDAAQQVLAEVQHRAADPDTDPVAREHLLRDARRRVEDSADKPWFDAYFRDARTGWVVGAYGVCFYTDDSGVSWRPWSAHLDNPENLHLYAVGATEQGIYMVGERGLVLRSTDAGLSFKQIKTPYQGSLFTLTSAPPSDLIVAGMNGRAFRSTDNGASWQQLLSRAGSLSWTAAARLNDGRVVLVNQFGQLASLQSKSSQLDDLLANHTGPVSAIIQARDGAMILAGLRGITRVTLPSQTGKNP